MGSHALPVNALTHGRSHVPCCESRTGRRIGLLEKSRRAIRAQTVHLSSVFSPFGLTFNKEQIPQIVENNKNQGVRSTRGKDFFCAQCALPAGSTPRL